MGVETGGLEVTRLNRYTTVSAFASVGDAELPSPASVLGAPSPVRRAGDRTPTSAGLCVLGDNADRIHVARLANPVHRGLDLAFPRAETSVTRPVILSVLVPLNQSPCTAEAQQGPSIKRYEGADTTPQPTLEGAPCGARRHREPPDDQGTNTPVDGKTWSRTPKKVARFRRVSIDTRTH